MKYISTEHLQPGMISQKAIYDDRGVRLLAANHEVTADLLVTLKRIHYPGLFIYDEFSKFENIREVFSEEKRVDTVKAMKKLDTEKVMYFSTDIVNNLVDMDDRLIELAHLRQNNHDIYNHSINVAILSAACGLGMGWGDEKVEELTLAAMLHDIGKSKIPDRILYKPGPLNDEEWRIMGEHPQIGYDMLYNNVKITTNVRMGILLHHENVDGTGYPRKLKGQKIPEFARIIHIADVYDAMIQKRSYKEEYDPGEVIVYLMEKGGEMFDFETLETFLSYVVIYPVGINVTLTNGRIARVVENHQSNQLRPVVVDIKTMEKIDLETDPNYQNIAIVGADQIFHEGDGLGKPNL